MNSEERRKILINRIAQSNSPLKGSLLANELNVSRQVVVQDIAILRERGYDILATSQGYIIYGKKSFITCIECNNHLNENEIYEELKIIVDRGATVKDVIVSHPIYGQIKAELNISSTRDILLFMDKIKNNEFKQLSSLSNQNHSHTIEASSQEIIDEIICELKMKKILPE